MIQSRPWTTRCPQSHLHLLIALPALYLATAAGAAEIPFATGVVIDPDPTFTGSSHVVAADLDGDGDQDVIVAGTSANTIGWLENVDGDGSIWTDHTIDASFGGVIWAVGADIDSDGDLDVLGAAAGADTVSWWENTAGDATAWTEHVVDDAFADAFCVVGADMDGDGDTDVVAAALGAGDVSWWENTAGNGTAWTEHSIDSSFVGAASVAVGDIDQDGDMDVLGSAAQTSLLSWWENTAGSGTTWTEHSIATDFFTPFAATLADVDGDGDLDALSASFSLNETAWFENTAGDGTAWTEHLIGRRIESARAISVADLDNDGDVDVMGVANIGRGVFWWENTAGDGSAWAETKIDETLGPRSVGAGDLDGDGDLDIMSSPDVIWWENETIHRSAAHSEKQVIDDAFGGAAAVHAADVDGNGELDVVGAASIAGDVSWWTNSVGDGSTWTEQAVDAAFAGAGAVDSADMDGDGDTDLLGAASSGSVSWWDNTSGDGSTWTEQVVDNAFTTALDVHAADVDGDGDVDMLGASLGLATLAWWDNTSGDGSTWTRHTIDNAFSGAGAVWTADLDHDGDLDVLGAARIANVIAWWENTAGDGTAWTRHTIDGAFGFARDVFAADMDGDGNLDVLGAAESDNTLAWWENTAGDGTAWTEHTIDSGFLGAASLVAADFDGDGDPDVLGGALGADEVAWWENTAGDGSAWTKHPVAAGFDAFSVVAADVDGDGDFDALGAARESGEVAWWQNRGGQFALPTTDLASARAVDGAFETVLEIEAVHRGRAGDSDAELAALGFLLTDAGANPLDDSQADALLASLSIYLDDGDGTFDAALDGEIATITSFSLSAGVLTVPFADDEASVQITYGTPRTYFVAVTFEADASLQIPDDLRLTLLTESGSRGEDAPHDLPISLESAADTSSSLIEINDRPIARPDRLPTSDGADVVANLLDDNGAGADEDEEGDPLTATLVDSPSLGTLVTGLAANGDLTYRPTPGVSGFDTFTYRTNDGLADSDLATVSILINPLFADGFESGDLSAWSWVLP